MLSRLVPNQGTQYQAPGPKCLVLGPSTKGQTQAPGGPKPR